MKRIWLVAVLFLSTVLIFRAETSRWEIDPVHASAQFSVRHLMVANVRGEFTKVAGVVNLDDQDVTQSTVEATIDAKSLNTREPKRDAHLKSAVFFDVEKFPTISFKSKQILKTAAGNLKVVGDLTMKGTTREVVLDVEGPSAEIKDSYGNLRRGASATTKINRKEFGLTYNTLLETGGALVGDEAVLTIDVELVKKPKQ